MTIACVSASIEKDLRLSLQTLCERCLMIAARCRTGRTLPKVVRYSTGHVSA